MPRISINKPEFAEEETDLTIKEPLLKLLDNETAALALIASYLPAKVTPTKSMPAEIGLGEEFGIQEAISQIKQANANKLLLLVNSFGGGVRSSFNVAQAIRKSFNDITVFIPHVAISGGTLIALTGNRFILGIISNMSPIDVQIERHGTTYSVNAMIRSFSALNDLFKDTSPEDAPYPWKAMADKLDPVEFQEWVDASSLMEQYALTILRHEYSSFKGKERAIVDKLSGAYPTHEYAITFEEAKGIFGEDNVKSGEEYAEIWDIMGAWMRKYTGKESSNHFIRYILPSQKKGGKEHAPSG